MTSNALNEQPECEETTGRMDKCLSTDICKNFNIVRICTAGDQKREKQEAASDCGVY